MLRKFFRKTPLSWLQLTREKTRLAVALAGIAFADILMFVQLGFRDALFNASVKPHYTLQGDLFLINPQFETLFSVKSFPRARLYQASGFEEVESFSYLYIGMGQWRNPDTQMERTILVFGIDPTKPAFNIPEVNDRLDDLKMLNRVLYDRAGRTEFGDVASLLQRSEPVPFQLNERDIEIAGLFSLGASFAADGNVIVSDSTFLNLFPSHQSDEVEIGALKLKPGTDIKQIQENLRASLPDDVLILTLDEFADREKTYWANGTAIGFIFGLGTVVGFIVGTVIVYQILYSDVSDHLAEYATLKAMGYNNSYLIGVLMQESLVLAFLGFIPGFFSACGLYYLAAGATLLPIGMNVECATTVLTLTIVMCSASGAIALRKLEAADPADIF
jgi:putative ABC transport system permease protein